MLLNLQSPETYFQSAFRVQSPYVVKDEYGNEIILKEKDGKIDWECPQCGNRDHNKLHVTRRTCGYLGSNF